MNGADQDGNAAASASLQQHNAVNHASPHPQSQQQQQSQSQNQPQSQSQIQQNQQPQQNQSVFGNHQMMPYTPISLPPPPPVPATTNRPPPPPPPQQQPQPPHHGPAISQPGMQMHQYHQQQHQQHQMQYAPGPPKGISNNSHQQQHLTLPSLQNHHHHQQHHQQQQQHQMYMAMQQQQHHGKGHINGTMQSQQAPNPSSGNPPNQVLIRSMRVAQILEDLRTECDALAHEANGHSAKSSTNNANGHAVGNTDAETKARLVTQMTEMAQMQSTISDLERAYMRMREKYEGEIADLRLQIEALHMKLNIANHNSAASTRPMSASMRPLSLTHSANKSASSQGQGLPGSTQGSRPRSQGASSTHSHSNGSNEEKPRHSPHDEISQSLAQLHPQALRSSLSAAFLGGSNGGVMQGPRYQGIDWLAFVHPPTQAEELGINAPDHKLGVEHLFTFTHETVVCCVKFSADGKLLAAGCNRAAYLYNVETGERLATLGVDSHSVDAQSPMSAGGESASANYGTGDLYIRSVSFSPDNRYIATGAEDKLIRIFDITCLPDAPKLVTVLHGHEQDIYALEYAKDGTHLVSGSGDKQTKLWNVEKGECVRTFVNKESSWRESGVTSVAMTKDGKAIATASLDKSVRIWDAATGELLKELQGHDDSVYSVSLAPDDSYLISGSLDATIRTWDLSEVLNFQTPQERVLPPEKISGHKDFVLSVAVTQNSKYIVTGSKDRSVQYWETSTGQPQLTLQGHKNSVISVAVSPAPNAKDTDRPAHFLATGSGDHRARLWRVQEL